MKAVKRFLLLATAFGPLAACDSPNDNDNTNAATESTGGADSVAMSDGASTSTGPSMSGGTTATTTTGPDGSGLTEAEDSTAGSIGPDTGLEGGSTEAGDPASCRYPQGAVEPMAVGEVLTPYMWSQAIHADGRQVALELADAPCGDDTVIDWSPHDVLVFVSVPAW